MPAGEKVALILCSDVVGKDSPLSLEAASFALRQRGSSPAIAVAESLCDRPARLLSAVRALRAERVVVGCQSGATHRDEIAAALSTAPVHPTACWVVDLGWPAHADRDKAVREAIARFRSALARVSCADLAAPTRQRAELTPSPVSRRELFHRGPWRQRPVAAWNKDCDADTHCRACVAACPHQALSLEREGVRVAAAACTGCGVCITACRRSAFALPAASIATLEGASGALLDDAKRLGSGIAVVCMRSTRRLPLGCEWLPLEVPSLEMVTAGWVLQLLAAGLSVKLLACSDEACVAQRRLLTSFCAGLAEVLGFSPAASSRLCQETTADLPVPAALAGWPTDRLLEGQLELHEPEATMRALPARLAAQPRPSSRRPQAWRIESPAAPLGEITVEQARCTACGCCVSACPTEAIAARESEPRSFTLVFTAALCTGCGACVRTCPEGALTLRRAMDGEGLSRGPVPLTTVAQRDRCASCGGPLAGGLSPAVLAERLAFSHPAMAGRLREEDRCADCLLSRSPLTLAGRHPDGDAGVDVAR